MCRYVFYLLLFFTRRVKNDLSNPHRHSRGRRCSTADVYAFGVMAAEIVHPDAAWTPWPANTTQLTILKTIHKWEANGAGMIDVSGLQWLCSKHDIVCDKLADYICERKKHVAELMDSTGKSKDDVKTTTGCPSRQSR